MAVSEPRNGGSSRHEYNRKCIGVLLVKSHSTMKNRESYETFSCILRFLSLLINFYLAKQEHNQLVAHQVELQVENQSLFS